MIAGKHRHHAASLASDLDDDPAGPAGDISAAHVAQIRPDQPGAGPQADQSRRAHPPLCRRLGVRQRQEAADLRGRVGRLSPFPRQRNISREKLRHDRAADEPLIRPQRPAGHPRQPRRAPGEPVDYRRVEYDLRCKLQAQRERVIGKPARCPQQVLRPLLPLRPGLRGHVPGERRRLRRHRRRPPPPDIGGYPGF